MKKKNQKISWHCLFKESLLMLARVMIVIAVQCVQFEKGYSAVSNKKF